MESTNRRRNPDPMSSLPLLNRNTTNDSVNNDPGWSDQEIEEFSQAPIEGVLRSVLHRPRVITRQQCVLSALFLATCAFALGFVFTLFVYPILWNNSHIAFQRGKTSRFILQEVHPDSIRSILRNLTSKPHIAGSEQNLFLANVLKEIWINNGIHNTKLVPYKVLLSYPDKRHPNVVQVKDSETGVVQVECSAVQTPLSPDETNPNVTNAFVAYSAAGTVTGDLVYVNYGRAEDFKWISEQNINLTGKIVIARYGKCFRGDIVRLAEQNGAAGVILYSDPMEYAAEGRDKVYPSSYWLPGTGIQSGTILHVIGDPTTPGYPSLDTAFRLSDGDLPVPGIPVQPINYNDAEKLLRLMGGKLSPPNWKGNLNVSYKIGPGFENKSFQVVLDVKNVKEMTDIYNVVGMIPGLEEPDRYVVVGNHRDAWIYGGIDPSSGTAVLTELTRVFGLLVKKGWKPRRTIVFCSWDAEEYGLIGSTEWVEDNAKVLSGQAVAYVNVDIAVEGNHSLFSRASPSMYDVIFKSAKQIPNPSLTEIAAGRLSVYDTWHHSSNTTLGTPQVDHLGAGSDFAAFIYFTGVPSCDYSYSPDKKAYPIGNPLYHSVYETYNAVEKLVDPDFKYHVAIAQLLGETVRALSDTPLLPLSISSYGKVLQSAFTSFKEEHHDYLITKNIDLEPLKVAIQLFFNVTHSFESSLTSKDLNNPLVLREVNDQLMQVERAFLIPKGLPGGSIYKHALISPSTNDSYSGQYFPGLLDLLAIMQRDGSAESQKQFREHLATVIYHIKSAVAVLRQL